MIRHGGGKDEQEVVLYCMCGAEMGKSPRYIPLWPLSWHITALNDRLHSYIVSPRKLSCWSSRVIVLPVRVLTKICMPLCRHLKTKHGASTPSGCCNPRGYIPQNGQEDVRIAAIPSSTCWIPLVPVMSQHLEVSLRVKLFRPRTSSGTRDWILEQVALGDVDVWQSIVACTIDWIDKRLKTGGHYWGVAPYILEGSY